MIDHNKTLMDKIAKLEMKLDYWETTFTRLDGMLKEYGFEAGVKTLADTLDEAIDLEQSFREEA